MKVAPDPARLADAQRRAACAAEQTQQRSNKDASRILALDVLLEFAEDIYDGDAGQLAWALEWAEAAVDLAPHEQRLRDDAWQKINDDGGKRMFGIESQELLQQNAGKIGVEIADTLAKKIIDTIEGFPSAPVRAEQQRAAIAGLVAKALREYGERKISG